MTEQWIKPTTKTSQTPDEVQIRDTFQTPRYATELLIPFIPKNIKWVWECACGDGRIVQVLTEHGYGVYPSDIRKSATWVNNHIHNFVSDDRPLAHYFAKHDEAIITNPPFSIKERFVEKAFEYKVPFAFLINADYSAQMIDWVRRGCEKIVPTSRIAYITPNILRRIHEGEVWNLSPNKNKVSLKTFKEEYKPSWIMLEKKHRDLHNYSNIDEVPQELLYKYSSAQFHSLWLTYGFGLGRTETFVDLPAKARKENI